MIEKLGRVENIFAPVTSDFTQCDPEITAVKKRKNSKRRKVHDGNENDDSEPTFVPVGKRKK